MGEVINFPGLDEAGIKKALAHIRNAYIKADLNESQISRALKEIEPIVRSFLVRKEFEFYLSGRFTPEQVEAVKSAHNAAAKEMMRYFTEQLWLSICQTADYIGDKAKNG